MRIREIIAIAAWLASMAAIVVFPNAIDLAVLTTLNLVHYRWTEHNSGEPFARRVRETLQLDVDKWEARIAAIEYSMEAVKDAQIKIGGAFVRRRP